jgi:hypothetical protein
LEAEPARIGALGLDELRALWRAMKKQNPPKVLTRDLRQKEAFGKLTRETRKLLDRLARGDSEPARHLTIGTVMRAHQDKLHEVMVAPDIGKCATNGLAVARWMITALVASRPRQGESDD